MAVLNPTPLAAALDQRTRPADLWQPLDGDRVRCVACGHKCPIPEGFPGVCKVRFNRGGTLYAPYGYVNGVAVDPIEKKPFFHVRPGTRAFSFGMLGCDLHCGYCQNWVSSQALRDPASPIDFRDADAPQLAALALRQGCEFVVSTYNEPLITAEWARDVFEASRACGLRTGFVSNGNATPEVLDYLAGVLDIYKIDLKSFDDRRYHELGGRLGPILDSIRRIHEMGIWLEIVTLLVPGFNDGAAELTQLTEFIAGISPDIPWHVTAFHPDYKMVQFAGTTAGHLERAAAIGRASGLHYVYAGNLPGMVGSHENTNCTGCGTTLVRRTGFRVLENRLAESGGRCPDCGAAVPGVWNERVE